MDHDKIFKQLLKTFFVEFISLFIPELAQYLSREKIEFLDKEIFTDLAGGNRSEVDLIAKCQFLDGGACFIVHMEDQNNPQSQFSRRMFHYFSRLDVEYGLPVYPIAVLSYDAPLRPEPDRYEVEFPDIKVLDFRFRVIQLNRLDWRDFAASDNPVASALMAKMHIEPEDRPLVKLACVRMMLRLPLNDAQRALIREFIDSYLRLNAQERVEYEHKAEALEPREKENVMAIMNEWAEAALEKGLAMGLERQRNLVLRQVQRQIGEISSESREFVRRLSAEHIDELGEALFSMKSHADLEAWLARHA